MRRPDVLRRREGDVDSMMAPMIDVVFLLLIFFLWTTSLQVIEFILPSQVVAQLGTEPSEITELPPEQDFDDVVIRIGWDGSSPLWRINEVSLPSAGELRDRLVMIADVKLDAPIIVHPEPLVPMEFVIEAYDYSRLAGFETISFAVSPPGSTP